MKEILSKLVDLAALDREIHALGEQLAGYPAMLAAMDSKEKEARKRQEGAVARHQAAGLARRNAEKEVLALREKIKKYQIQQNQVKNQKELDAVTHEIQTVNDRIDELEMTGLEQLDAEETAGGEIESTRDALAELKAENDIERERIAGQIEAKEKRLEDLGGERKARFAAIDAEDPDAAEMYDLLNRRSPGQALVPVESRACSGCGRALRDQLMIELHRMDKIMRCENCQKIIYDPELVG